MQENKVAVQRGFTINREEKGNEMQGRQGNFVVKINLILKLKLKLKMLWLKLTK